MKNEFIFLIALAMFSVSSCKKDLPDHAYYCERCGGVGYKFFENEIYGKCISCRGRGYFFYKSSDSYYTGRTPNGEISFRANYGKCNACDDCKFYTPASGTTYCVCGDSKHSHIGM